MKILAPSTDIGVIENVIISATPPPTAEQGHLRFDENLHKMQYFDGTEWITIGSGGSDGDWFKSIIANGSLSVVATSADDVLNISTAGELAITKPAGTAKSFVIENTHSEPQNCYSVGTYPTESEYRRTDINATIIEAQTIGMQSINIHLRAGEYKIGGDGTVTIENLNITADAGATLIIKDDVILRNCSINVPEIYSQLCTVGGYGAVQMQGECYITCDKLHDFYYEVSDPDGVTNKPMTYVTIHCQAYGNNTCHIVAGIVTIHAEHNHVYAGQYSDSSTYTLHGGRLEIHGLHYRDQVVDSQIFTIVGQSQITLIDCRCYTTAAALLKVESGVISPGSVGITLRNSILISASYCLQNASGVSHNVLNQGSMPRRGNYGTWALSGDAWNTITTLETFD